MLGETVRTCKEIEPESSRGSCTDYGPSRRFFNWVCVRRIEPAGG